MEPHIDFGALGMLAARVAPICFFIPPGGDSIAASIRFVVGAAFVWATYWTLPMTGIECSLLAVAREIAVGLVLSLPSVLFFSAAAALSEIIDIARGQMVANVYDPFVERASLLSKLHSEFLAVLFVASGGVAQALTLVADSCRILPLGQAPTLGRSGELGLRMIETLWPQLLAPLGALLILTLLVEFSFVLMGKFAAGIKFSLEPYTLRSLVAGLWYLSAINSGVFWQFSIPSVMQRLMQGL